jgi:hypothetical protein
VHYVSSEKTRHSMHFDFFSNLSHAMRLVRFFCIAVLLTSLCQASKMMGETGYYLASFEAALEHIKELDLHEYANTEQ